MDTKVEPAFSEKHFPEIWEKWPGLFGVHPYCDAFTVRLTSDNE
jgi:hypothetical protein